ncbi:hypothetical protein ABZW18_24725 [Streptomyces sp. NPDC004647]|uniref:hypothetical protein n=1 Tax=Streptomyces sp. NPDC004647 TaxID=3154671 RepID=UPI0033A6680A
MSTAAGQPDLGNLALSRKEDFRAFASTPRRIQPALLSRAQLRALGAIALAEYNRLRREWHANLGPIKTPQLAELHEDLWDIVDSNLQDGDKAKGAVAVDAFPGWARPRPCWRSPGNSTAGRSPSTASSPPRGTSAGRSAGSG